jgi:hypothetical protein
MCEEGIFAAAATAVWLSDPFFQEVRHTDAQPRVDYFYLWPNLEFTILTCAQKELRENMIFSMELRT